MSELLDTSIYVFGIAAFLYVLLQLWRVFYAFVVGPIVNAVDFKSYGEWAMVTGSTDGIGKEYARQLAAKGCNVILVSRTLSKLNAVAEEIEKEFNVKTKVIQCDFSATHDIYDDLLSEIAGLEVGVLVNNVGLSYDYPEYFMDIPEWLDVMNSLLRVNCVSVIRTSALVLPSMLKRRKGIIINVGSGTSEFPSPMLTVYAATKAFVSKFTVGLAQEYNKDGIIFQCVTPGYVATNMSGFRSTSFFIASPRDYVRSALSLVNTTDKTTGYFSHALMEYGLNYLKAVSGGWTLNRLRKTLERSRNSILKRRKQN